MTGPPLREPDLPRTAKVRTKALRTGFSTGACAAAAAKAAIAALGGTRVRAVTIGFPSGDRHEFAVHSLRRQGGVATAVVV
jgi:cobalt-precorrin-5B (C1)-methyltransferase